MSDIIKLLQIGGGVWETRPVAEAPEIVLRSWRVIEIENEARHFIGYNETEGEGRVSSKIITFDKETKRGVTRSGRVYQLIGSPGFNDDALYVWARWKQINKVEVEKDVTGEL